MSFDGDKQRQKSKLQMKQTCTYRKASSFVRRQSDAAGSNSSVGLKPSISKDVNLINKSRLNRGSDALTPDHMMESYSSDSSMSECNFPGGEDEYSFPALFPVEELIRELSFSPPRPKKKRANTADTEASLSSSETSLEREEHRHRRNAISIDLDLKHSQEKGRPSSPLLGLQYLPDHGISSNNSGES